MATSTSSMRSTIGSSAGGFLARVIRRSLVLGVRCTRWNWARARPVPDWARCLPCYRCPPTALRGLPRCSAVRSRASRASANAFGLPAASGAVVVLVDGLGAANLQPRAGHARFLAIAARQARRHPHGVPRRRRPRRSRASRTGRMPGEHGLVGYRVLDAAQRPPRQPAERLGRRHACPRPGSAMPTLFETARPPRHADASPSAPPRYADSGFTHARAARRGVPRRPRSIADRFAEARRLLAATSRRARLPLRARARPGRARARLGVRPLARRSSSSSTPRSPPSSGGCRVAPGLLVTADHGVIDVPAHRHVFVDARPELRRRASATSAASRGASRSTSSRASTTPARAALVERWRAAEGAPGVGAHTRRGDRGGPLRRRSPTRCCRASATSSSPRARASPTTTGASRTVRPRR